MQFLDYMAISFQGLDATLLGQHGKMQPFRIVEQAHKVQPLKSR